MDVVNAIRNYVQKMVKKTPGLKVLLMDRPTMQVVSMVYSQSEILEHEVFLLELLENNKRQKMQHLKCLIFCRPTSDNVKQITAELKEPKYGEYNLFFSNVLAREHLERLAASDENELVNSVQEYFADYHAVNKHLFSLNTPTVIPLMRPFGDPKLFERVTDGLAACLLSLKKKPNIRYQKSSDLARQIARDLHARMENDPSLFDFRRSETAPLLLILDRKNDPVTPLLTQWTYQAMVHELIGIDNNRVNLQKVNKKLEEIVLSAEQDTFFADNMYSNFGDLCVNIKKMVDEFKEKAKVTQNISTIDDMKRIMENLPQFQSSSGLVSKHLNLVTELSSIQNSRNLMEISRLEQEIVCEDNHSQSLSTLQEIIRNPKVSEDDALRVVMLYALKYESNPKNATTRLIDLLYDKGLDSSRIQLVKQVLKYAGSSQHDPELFGTKNLSTFVKKFTSGLKDVANVFTQHQPLLRQLLDAAIKGRLKDNLYPAVFGSTTIPHKEIIVFIVGGATFEEAMTVHNMCKENPNVKIILGGTTILNSSSFMEELTKMSEQDQQHSNNNNNNELQV